MQQPEADLSVSMGVGDPFLVGLRLRWAQATRDRLVVDLGSPLVVRDGEGVAGLHRICGPGWRSGCNDERCPRRSGR